MRKFLCNVLLFVLPVMSILVVVDYIYSNEVEKSNYEYIESWYDLMHGNIDAEVVVMGNSRAWVHVNPLILDSILNTTTYNLGIDGSSINRQIHKYNLFRKYNVKPKLIIQNIDLTSLKYRVGYAKEQFLPYFWNEDMREEMIEAEPFSVWEKYVPFYRYYRNCGLYTLSVLYLTKSPRMLTKGYQGKERHWDGTAFEKVSTIQFCASDTTLSMFDDYLAKAKDEGIKVIFVYAPLYAGAIRKISNIEEMYETYGRIARKYDIPILNYMKMDICSDTAYFYNAMHLNKRGAEIYSDTLAKDIQRLGLLDSQKPAAE